MAEWTTAYVNDLPDSAFLMISPGGSKDEEGKTTPRDLRHFPYRDASGKVDLPHLRDAIGRIPQSDLPATKKQELQAHAQKLLEKENSDAADRERVFRLDLAVGEVRDRKRTPQGGLVADANLTRTGVFEYRMPDGSKRRELRHPDEVFHPDSLATYRNAPVTVDHPGRVGPDNWKTHAVGTIGSDVRRNGDFVSGEVHLQHGDAIKRADAGELREVSCGYSCDIDPIPGQYQGQPYDVAQRRIRMNHVAIGPRGWGRMGPDTKMHLDAADAVSGEGDGTSYVRDAQHTETTTMADDNKQLEKANADLAKANADLEKARQDAKDAKTEGERLAAKAREDAAEIASLKAQRELDRAKIAQLTADSTSDEARQRQDAQRQADIEEMIALRADAKYVFATTADPEAKNWKHDGKSADQIRREILASIAPNIKLDGIDEITRGLTGDSLRSATLVQSRALRGIYEQAMTHKRDTDRSRADALATATAQKRADEMGGGSGGFGGDDDEEPNAEKARKDMVKRKKDAWKMARKDRGRALAAAK